MSKSDLNDFVIDNIIKADNFFDAKSIEQNECETLIKNIFLKDLKLEYPTYYQINSFINLLAGQLKKLSMNFTLSATNLIESGIVLRMENLNNSRELVIKNFIKNINNFIHYSFDKIYNAQKDIYEMRYLNQKERLIANKKLLYDLEYISSYHNLEPFLFLFTEEGQNFRVISIDPPINEEYYKLLNLTKSIELKENYIYKTCGYKDKIIQLSKEIKNYKKINHYEFLEELKEFLSIKNPLYTKDKEIFKDGKSQISNMVNQKSIEEIVGDYVFTIDNFIKMILILLRERENIPVIMMGETGCGKTFLIRKLSEIINNGESWVKILNLHEDLSNEDIVEFLFAQNIHANFLKEKEKFTKDIYKASEIKYTEKKLWVFFDDINSCNCLGLINEIMTKHSCQGIKLPDNIFFIGACHPYRFNEKIIDNNMSKNYLFEKNNLEYKVNPLPFSLMNFVVNFGNLSSADGENYIKNMVDKIIDNFILEEIEEKNKKIKDFKKNFDKNVINKYLSKRNVSFYQEFKNLTSKAVKLAQDYIREKNGISSVSIRDLRRFCIFSNFFDEYYKKNRNFYEKERNENLDIFGLFYKKLKNRNIYLYSIELSIYLCYYLRLPTLELRREFAQKMNEIFSGNFVEIVKHEQQYIAKNIEITSGISINRIVLENLFALFSCINAKIPLFIVGESGFSRNLSIQLLYKSMKGKNSFNILFKLYPSLYKHNSYICHLDSTSKGILGYFEMARFDSKEMKKDINIYCLCFFSMEYLIHSNKNLLQYINSQLDYEQSEGGKNVAFVGFSNYLLDSATMNRGIVLAIPQLDKKELEYTAL